MVLLQHEKLKGMHCEAPYLSLQEDIFTLPEGNATVRSQSKVRSRLAARR